MSRFVKHPIFNNLDELDRLSFILNRDGIEQAKEYARILIKIYLEASLRTRQKFKTKKYPYRFAYLESAYSARYILRHNILDNIKSFE